MHSSDVYNRLVKDENDVTGHIAYGLYKRAKAEFISKQQLRLGVTVIPEDVIDEFHASQTDYMLEFYRTSARQLLRNFLDSSYQADLTNEKQEIAQEYAGKYHELAKAVKPSFWFGVLQSITASFLFLLTGYIILKMNGVWDILLNNLFR